MGYDPLDWALEEPPRVSTCQFIQSYVHQHSRHSAYLVREKGVTGHLDSDGLFAFPYVY